jgi:hypothetical protein
LRTLWLNLRWWWDGVLLGLRNIYKSKTFWTLMAVLIVNALKTNGWIPDNAVTDSIEVVGLILAAIFRAGATQDLQAPK